MLNGINFTLNADVDQNTDVKFAWKISYLSMYYLLEQTN